MSKEVFYLLRDNPSSILMTMKGNVSVNDFFRQVYSVSFFLSCQQIFLELIDRIYLIYFVGQIRLRY